MLRTILARWSRGQWLIAVGGVVAGAVLAVVLLHAVVVRAVIRAAAARRGAEVRIETVHMGWWRVWLEGVDVRVVDMPALRLRLSTVEANLSPTFHVKGIAVHGGTFAVLGDPDDVARQVEQWRRTRTSGGSGSRSGAWVSADGLAVAWHRSAGSSDCAYAWGVDVERDQDGGGRIGVGLARVQLPWFAGEARGVRIAIARSGGTPTLETLSVESTALRLILDAASGRTPSASKSSSRSTRVAAKTEVEASALARAFATLREGERGPKLRAALARVADWSKELLRPGARLTLDGLKVRLEQGVDRLNIGPSRLAVWREDGSVRLELLPGQSDLARAAPGHPPLALDVRIPFGTASVDAHVDGGPVSLASIGVEERDFGLVDVGRSTLAAQGDLSLADGGTRLIFSGKGALRDVSIDHPALSASAIHDLSLGWSARGDMMLDGSRLALEEGELSVGAVRISAKGLIESGPGYAHVKVSGGVPLASCQALVDSLPDGLVPLVRGVRIAGTFGLDGSIELDTRHVADLRVEFDLTKDCRFTEIPDDLSPRRFMRAWSREVLGADGLPMTIESGPGSESWVPYDEISPFMETGVLVCEDGRFFSHDGFDREALKNSLRENILAGRFVRGASTLTMQLAKNVYLYRDKTLSRKLQEAFATMLLEQELSKKELMELYLNVVEFGPGIYGIGPAAKYYFDSVPARLSLAQSLYLASILPNPRRQYFDKDGALDVHRATYVRRLMEIAYKRHRITDAELEEGLKEQVVMGVPSAAAPAQRDAAETSVPGAAGSPELGAGPPEEPGP